MADEKSASLDGFFLIDEAARISGISVDRLIQFGADGKLPIYVRAYSWETRGICEIEDATGKIRFIDRHGPEGALYKLPLFDELPLTQSCLRQFKNRVENVQIALDLNRILSLQNQSSRRYLTPEVSFSLSEELMVVAVSDLDRLTNENAARAGQSPGMAKATNGQLAQPRPKRASTDERYMIWQQMATDIKRKHPGHSKSQIANMIATELARKKSELARDPGTIRKHIDV